MAVKQPSHDIREKDIVPGARFFHSFEILDEDFRPTGRMHEGEMTILSRPYTSQNPHSRGLKRFRCFEAGRVGYWFLSDFGATPDKSGKWNERHIERIS